MVTTNTISSILSNLYPCYPRHASRIRTIGAFSLPSATTRRSLRKETILIIPATISQSLRAERNNLQSSHCEQSEAISLLSPPFAKGDAGGFFRHKEQAPPFLLCAPSILLNGEILNSCHDFRTALGTVPFYGPRLLGRRIGTVPKAWLRLRRAVVGFFSADPESTGQFKSKSFGNETRLFVSLASRFLNKTTWVRSSARFRTPSQSFTSNFSFALLLAPFVYPLFSGALRHSCVTSASLVSCPRVAERGNQLFPRALLGPS